MTDEERRAKRARDSKARKDRMAADPDYAESLRAKNRERNNKRFATDPEYRERVRAYMRKRHEDLEKRAADRAVRLKRYAEDESLRERRRANCRRRSAELRSPPEGHPGTCDLCGADCPPSRDGRSGLNQDHRHDNGKIRGHVCHRCNFRLSVLDLRFTAPDEFAALLAWSNIGAPVAPTGRKTVRTRKPRLAEPRLFEK